MIESEYTPLWEAIKASTKSPKQVSIAANRALHPRIIKAIQKRKNLDIGYKLQMEGKRAILYYIRDSSKLTFILEFFPEKTIEELKKEAPLSKRFYLAKLELD